MIIYPCVTFKIYLNIPRILGGREKNFTYARRSDLFPSCNRSLLLHTRPSERLSPARPATPLHATPPDSYLAMHTPPGGRRSRPSEPLAATVPSRPPPGATGKISLASRLLCPAVLSDASTVEFLPVAHSVLSRSHT